MQSKLLYFVGGYVLLLWLATKIFISEVMDDHKYMSSALKKYTGQRTTCPYLTIVQHKFEPACSETHFDLLLCQVS